MTLGCNKRTLQHGSTYANSHSRSHHSNHHTNYHPSHQQTHGGATHGAGAAPTRDARGYGYGHVAQNNGYHTSHLQHNGGYHETMTEASNMMSPPPHIETQVGQGGVQFGDLNVGQLSKEVENGIMPLQGLNRGGLFNVNVSPSMGIQNIPNMTNMAAMGPTLSINNLGGGGIPNVAALNVCIPNVSPNMVPSLSGGSPIMSLTGSLSNVELGIGMGSVINPTFDDFSKHMPSLAFGDPTGVPAGVQIGTAWPLMWINGECFHKEKIVSSINTADNSVYFATSASSAASRIYHITKWNDLDTYRFKIMNKIDCKCKKIQLSIIEKKKFCAQGWRLCVLFFFCFLFFWFAMQNKINNLCFVSLNNGIYDYLLQQLCK